MRAKTRNQRHPPRGGRRIGCRGASMVEAVFMISIFIMFFIGQVYFRSLYENKLHVQRLGRAAAVAFAMNACQGNDPLAPVKPDLGSAQNNGTTGSTQGNSSGIQAQPTGSVGTGGGDPVGGAMQGSGFTGDPIAVFNLQAAAAGTAQQGLSTVGFQSTVHTTASMSCGDKQEGGNVSDAIQYVIGEFKTQ
jgi:hypothetical protein